MTMAGRRIIIVGAGLAGSLLATLLAREGDDVEVYERRSDPRKQGYVGGRSINLALSARGIHGLQRAGLAERILADAIPMRGRMMHLPAGSLAFQPYSKDAGDTINSVSRGLLNMSLLSAAEETGRVKLHFERRCADVDFEHNALRLADADGRETTASADLIIATDGAYSAVRYAFQRLDRFNYNQHHLEHGYKELTIPPTATGEFAMEPNALHIWPWGGSMMIALPNKDRSFTCTLFWPFQGEHSFDSIRERSQVEPFFRTHYADAVPLMPTLVDDFMRNPIGSLVTVRCWPWHHKGRIVLLGDAAHAIVPFYGQGMNCAFEDCVALVDCLKQYGSDHEAACEAYQAMRKPNADAIADMALENFVEMRDHVASTAFLARKKLEKALHKLMPERFMPLYNMVSFSLIPYAEARARALRQNRMIRTSIIMLATVLTLALTIILLTVLR